MKVKSESEVVSTLQDPMTAAHQVPPSMGFSRQVYWSGVPLTLEGTNSRITEAEDRISEVEDRMVELYESESKKEKRIKRNKDNLRDLWDNVNRPNIRII